MFSRHALLLLVGLTLATPAADAQQPNAALGPGVVETSIETIAALIQREYFDADAGLQVANALREGLSEGRFPNLTTAADVATTLNHELLFLTNDRHLAISAVAPSRTGGEAGDQCADDLRRSNAGVQRVEILPGNVGYLNLTCFSGLSEAEDAIAAAMHLLGRTDALILDVRINAGGTPEIVARLMGYLFEQTNLPLFDIVSRAGEAQHYTTPPSRPPALQPALPSALPSEAGSDRPVYVLTSSRTMFAGEALAFLMQERKRAEVIGEVTAGAANPGRPYPVNEALTVTIPNGQVKSATSGGTWQGRGVTPDLAVPAADALTTAHRQALSRLIAAASAGAARDCLERDLASLAGR